MFQRKPPNRSNGGLDHERVSEQSIQKIRIGHLPNCTLNSGKITLL